MIWMLFIGFIENSIQTGLLIVFLVSILFFLRHSPKVYSYILWILVFTRLMVPISVSAPMGILPEVSLEGILYNRNANTVFGYGKAVRDRDVLIHSAGTAQNKSENLLSSEEGVQGNNSLVEGHLNKGELEGEETGNDGDLKKGEGIDKTKEISEVEGVKGKISLLAYWIVPGDTIVRIIWIIWLLGVFLMGCHGVWGSVRLQKILRNAVRYEKFGMNNVYQCHGVQVPIVNGIFRQRVYLPELSLAPYQEQYILEHERIHIRRKDSLIKAVSYGLLCLHWFNPFVWLAFIQLERNMEYSCDEAVVRRLGKEQKKAYSRTLLAMAAGECFREKREVSAVGFIENDTKKRVKNLLKFHYRGKWITVAVTMILIGVFVCFLGGRGNVFPGRGWGGFGDVENKVSMTKEGKGNDAKERTQDKENKGLPVIVVNNDGNIISTYRGEALKKVVLWYTNNIKNGEFSQEKRGEGYRIERGAFSDCVNMKRLVVVNSRDVSFVAEDAFQGCPSDLEIYCDEGTYLWKRLQELGITPLKNREDGDIAVMLSGEEKTKEIETKAFASLSEKEKESMRKDFGDLVMAIGLYSSLTREEVQDYEGNPYYIMTEAGRLIDTGGSIRVETRDLGLDVKFPSEAKIVDMLFKDNFAMAQAKIPFGVEEIGVAAFDGSGLKKLEFETEKGRSTVKKISHNAFHACEFSDSARLIIPEGVEELGDRAFSHCTGLEEIVLPKSLKKIGGDCFAGCFSLKKVIIYSTDVVFDGEKTSLAYDGIFTLCGVEYIKEKEEFTKPAMEIHGPKDSTAQQYAAEMKIPFKSID